MGRKLLKHGLDIVRKHSGCVGCVGEGSRPSLPGVGIGMGLLLVWWGLDGLHDWVLGARSWIGSALVWWSWCSASKGEAQQEEGEKSAARIGLPSCWRGG